ncbi:MAG: hypothetical protein NC394_01480 [Bacteroides sp.]|nr:hypothetical protein [Bacteroides sp.]
MSDNILVNGKALLKTLKQTERQLRGDKLLNENHLFERELKGLIKSAPYQHLTVSEGAPLLGREIFALEEINDKTVSELIYTLSQTRYIKEEDLISLIWQCKLYIVLRAAGDRENPQLYLDKMYKIKELDEEALEELSPLHRAFSFDEVYKSSSRETRGICRGKAALISRLTEIDERQYTGELIKRAVLDDLHVGEVIEEDYRNIYPYVSSSLYISVQLCAALALSLAAGIFTRLWTVPLTFFPILGAVKCVVDLIASGFSRAQPLPRIEIGEELPQNGRTLCVMSALVSGSDGLRDALERLKTAKLKNPQKGIFFCLLCDLSPSDTETRREDEKLFAEGEALRQSIFPDCSVIFRKRAYSRTMRKYQGFDRKRGAIEELVKYMCGMGEGFYRVLGDISELPECELIAALDLDTVPLMDSIRELAAIALHPLNKDYGIIAPRCTSSLGSTLKTPFSRAMAGNGGVSGISAYDSFGGEFYFDMFGEGIFCGKGLIRKRAFLKRCCDRFRPERVLSHDILEGGLAGVAYAGDAEFSDSFPSSSRSYFKRAHRWIRGDLQNFRFLFFKEFSPLTKYKLFDNIRRGLDPVFELALFFLSCFVRNGFILGIAAYVSLLLPFIPPLVSSAARGLAFGIKRRFYSPIVSEVKQLASKALLEIMTLPKAAAVSFDALVKTLWRGLVTKRNLLQWTTSGFLEKTAFKGGFWHLLFPFALSALLTASCIYGSGMSVLPAALLMCAALPFFVYADKPRSSFSPELNEAAKKELLSQVQKMWSFYADHVNEKTSWLPPDNVQLKPVYRVCKRTSPTNIGMYMLSAAAVFELGLISAEELADLAEKTVSTVEKLPKWRGNLYNWYETDTLKTVSGFVSSVDSGNFFCCIIAVKECLRLNKLSPELCRRLETIINNTRLSEFYQKKHKLFSIGFDTEKNEMSPHKYDMLMSEARLLSYAAIATGQAPKAHWRALSRTMSRSGAYAGAVAWTGTMFEFFMPELLLASKEGSMCYEALKYAFHCQKRRHTPFGISESGYYAFDGELNYQYKAHGVQKTALKGGMDKECVVSPYSSYLTLAMEPLESYNNLCRLEKEGAFDPQYGFYEAVDYTRRRVGRTGGAVVKSHMAHHVGMSIAGAANVLKDNICSKLFLSDERIKRAEELSEEKIMAGEKVLNADYRCGEEKMPAEREEIKEQTVSCSPVNPLCGGSLTLFTSANGLFSGSYKGAQTVHKTRDYLNRPHGAFYGFCDENGVYPLFYHPKFKTKLRAVFSENETLYASEEKSFGLEMTVRAVHNAEIRSFSVKNRTRSKKQLTLCLYSEPTLAPEADHAAHPMFLDLFLKIEYDSDARLFVFYRKDRDGGRTVACAAGFIEEGADFTYCFSKEACLNYAPFSFFEKALIRECADRCVPSPCLFVKNDITLDSGETKRLTFFYCYADSAEEAKKAAAELRLKGMEDIGQLREQNAPSPLSLSTVHGRMASAALPALLYGEIGAEEGRISDARRKNSLNRRELWKYGISGDLPLLVTEEPQVRSAALLKRGLDRCNVGSDLIVLCENGLEKSAAEAELAGCGYAFIKSELPEDILTLMYALAAKTDLQALPLQPSAGEKQPLPVLPCTHTKEESGFTDEGYVISGEENTWCNILSNSQFGTLLSQNSLGFTWALNSRENKLTPWENDPIADNGNELLLLKLGSSYCDMIRGSRAEFTPQYCSYTGRTAAVEFKTDVRVYERGLGKELSVTLSNSSDKEQRLHLVYKLSPLLGDRREMSMPTARTDKGVLLITNPQNPEYHGAMVLHCSKKALYSFSELDTLAGDFSACLEEVRNVNAESAAVIVPLILPPREKLRVRYILGYSESVNEAASDIKALDGSPCGFRLENSIEISTPDGRLNRLFNTWLPHQALSCRLWGRTGFFQNGGGFGFRDQLQDCLCIMYLSPETASEHIFRCCQSQFPEGDVLHWWHDLNGKKVGVRTRCSDDLLWLPYVASEYAESFGDKDFWSTEAEYCAGRALPDGKNELYMEAESSGLKESLFLHCKRAMEKAFNKGKNGLLTIGSGDWNDGYNKVGAEGKGESVWLSMFYVLCGRKFAPVAREQGEGAYAEELEKNVADLCVAIEENAWDNDRYLRAFYDDGKKMGSDSSEACRIDLLPQAFAALCGLPDTARTVIASNTAWERLVDEKNGIIKLFSPPFDGESSSEDPGYVKSYPIGVRENGGQYTHGAVWYCLSCFELGQNKRAFELLNMLNPAYKDKRFGREPYFMTADIYTNPHCYGRGGWSMYTGAAAWYWKCIFEGLFGVKISGDKVIFAPRLPAEFDGTKMKLVIGEAEINAVFKYKGNGGNEVKVKLDGVKEVEVEF